MLNTMRHMEKERENIRVAVVGAGAIGGVVAAFLARAGWDLEITSEGEFVIGSLDSGSEGRLPLIKQMLDGVAPTRISRNIMGELYAKLIINACINSLGVIAGKKLGELLAIKRARKIFITIMREAMAVAAAVGIKVERGGGGRLDYYRFLEGGGVLSQMKRNLLIRVIGFKYRKIKSSSLQSLERGRKTEIDYLNGYICARGRQHGIPTSINDAVVKMLKEIESGQRKMTPENLKNPVFANL